MSWGIVCICSWKLTNFNVISLDSCGNIWRGQIHLNLNAFSQVTHVINFDFPTSIVDYIHRVGRTGRVKTEATRKGVSVATSLLTHNRDVRMAKTIEVGQLYYVFQILVKVIGESLFTIFASLA